MRKPAVGLRSSHLAFHYRFSRKPTQAVSWPLEWPAPLKRTLFISSLHAEAQYPSAVQSLAIATRPRLVVYANTISVVAAFSSHPRVGSAVTEEISLIEICRPRVLGLFTSIFDG